MLDCLPISFVGAYSEAGEYRLLNTNLPRERLPSTTIDFSCASASLDRVSKIQIFYVPGTLFCRGIIFQYDDGLRRALGQCRVGIDEIQVYARPSHICFIHTTYRQPHMDTEFQGVKVLSTIFDQDHNHEGTSWTCCEMSGVLEMK